MLIKMQSTEMLPTALRGTFELPCWHTNAQTGQIVPEFREYLKQYTIFRYMDGALPEEGGRGSAILIPDAEGTWPHQWESPITAYDHMLWVHDDTLKIGSWPAQAEDTALHQKITEGTKDNYAWGLFNHPVKIHRVNKEMIHYISGHNVPGNITEQRIIETL